MKRIVVNLDVINALPVTQQFLVDLRTCADIKHERIGLLDMDSDCFKALWDTHAGDREMPEPPYPSAFPAAALHMRPALVDAAAPSQNVAPIHEATAAQPPTPVSLSPSVAQMTTATRAAPAKKPCNCKGRSLNR